MRLDIPEGARKRPLLPITKGFRVSQAEALALQRIAERENVDESVVLRLALKQLPGFDAEVRRAEVDLKAAPPAAPKKSRGKS